MKPTEYIRDQAEKHANRYGNEPEEQLFAFTSGAELMLSHMGKFAEWIDIDHTQVKDNIWGRFGTELEFTTLELLNEYFNQIKP